MRGTLFIIISLMGFILFGIILEQSDYFTPIRVGLQDRSIPSPLLNFGKRGQIMKRLGLQYVVPKDFSRLFNQKTGDFEIGNTISLDTSRLKYRKDWANPKQITPDKMPSSLVMDKKITSQKIPILSVVIDRHDLYDQFTGIFKNYFKKGRSWERPCYISYYQGGKLLFATGAGVRVHGGKSRSHKLKSIRLYFRDIYGSDQFKPGILFDRGSEPLKHLVVRKTVEGYSFVNPLAFDISREIGSIAPQAKPVKLYLNGSLYGHGTFELIEHLSREYVMSHYGHDNFIFYRIKGRKNVPDEYRELMRWARRGNAKITMEEAQKRINIDNFSRWWISHLFCANSDPYQGVALLDKSKVDPRWFWINWDMDHSFRNVYERDIQNLWEQKKIIYELMFKKRKVTKRDPRAVIFRRLLNEDPEYRNYFQQLLTQVLNHRLNQNYLKSVVDFYEKTAISFGITDRKYFNEIRLFMKHRPAFLMKLMQRYCSYPEVYPCQVKGPEGIIYRIDGFVHRTGFMGWYFKDSEITVEVERYQKNISHWIVNGKRVNSQGRKLVHVIDAATVIKPVF
jgi:hypothetical protein